MSVLFKFDRRASFFKLFLDVFSFVFASAFLNGSRSAFYSLLRFLQTKTGDTANSFNDSDFIVTETSQNDVKFVFLSSRFTTSRSSSWSSSNRSSSR